MRPKNKDEVTYYNEGQKIISRIEYPCGCWWRIIWNDITKGDMESCEPSCFCDEHDPTTDENGDVLE